MKRLVDEICVSSIFDFGGSLSETKAIKVILEKKINELPKRVQAQVERALSEYFETKKVADGKEKTEYAMKNSWVESLPTDVLKNLFLSSFTQKAKNLKGTLIENGRNAESSLKDRQLLLWSFFLVNSDYDTKKYMLETMKTTKLYNKYSGEYCACLEVLNEWKERGLI